MHFHEHHEKRLGELGHLLNHQLVLGLNRVNIVPIAETPHLDAFDIIGEFEIDGVHHQEEGQGIDAAQQNVARPPPGPDQVINQHRTEEANPSAPE